jgi:hypothetical protein
LTACIAAPTDSAVISPSISPRIVARLTIPGEGVQRPGRLLVLVADRLHRGGEGVELLLHLGGGVVVGARHPQPRLHDGPGRVPAELLDELRAGAGEHGALEAVLPQRLDQAGARVLGQGDDAGDVGVAGQLGLGEHLVVQVVHGRVHAGDVQAELLAEGLDQRVDVAVRRRRVGDGERGGGSTRLGQDGHHAQRAGLQRAGEVERRPVLGGLGDALTGQGAHDRDAGLGQDRRHRAHAGAVVGVEHHGRVLGDEVVGAVDAGLGGAVTGADVQLDRPAADPAQLVVDVPLGGLGPVGVLRVGHGPGVQRLDPDHHRLALEVPAGIRRALGLGARRGEQQHRRAGADSRQSSHVTLLESCVR